MNHMRFAFIAVLLLFFFFFIVGYMAGTYVTIKAVVDVASRFVDIDYTLVKQALFQYNNNIGVGFPIK